MPLFFLSCADNNPPVANTTSNTEVIKDSTSLVRKPSLETFKTLPSAIDGCSGLFHMRGDSSHNVYVFVMDLQGRAFIKRAGEMIELARIKQSNLEGVINEVYKADDIEVNISLKELKQAGDELWNYEGVLLVQLNGSVEKLHIEGEVGC